jgi:hypothetical protein
MDENSTYNNNIDEYFSVTLSQDTNINIKEAKDYINGSNYNYSTIEYDLIPCGAKRFKDVAAYENLGIVGNYLCPKDDF